MQVTELCRFLVDDLENQSVLNVLEEFIEKRTSQRVRRA